MARVFRSPSLLWIPALGLMMTAAQLIWGGGIPQINPYVNRFIVNIILLDAVHLGFTYAILFGTTPGRGLLQSKRQGPRASVWTVAAVVTILTIFLTTLIYRKVFNVPYLGAAVSLAYFWIWALIPSFHAIRQSSGLGLLINRRLEGERSPADAHRLRQFEKQERRALNTLCLAVLAGLVMDQTEVSNKIYWLGMASAVALLSGFFLCGKIWLEPLFRGTDKLIFSLRFLLWPLIFFSQAPMYFLFFIHGQEYISLFFKFLGIERDAQSRKRTISIAIGFLGLIVALCTWSLVLGLNNTTPWDQPWKVAVPFALLPLINLVHYVTDSFIYRMSDKDVRSTIGQALTSESH